MQKFWDWVDRTFVALSSVKLTIVILVGLLLLAIPGTVILQYNVSNVDPGLQYSYDFWKFGKTIQLFTAYHSFWYSSLVALLAMNLIACSIERWPQMWLLANAKPVAWADETFDLQPKPFLQQWSGKKDKQTALAAALTYLKKRRVKPVIVEDGSGSFQIFFQTGRWSRIANYLVHTALLVIFAGAIFTALYGFEGAANIPAGQAVDTLIMFKEGKGSNLKPVAGGLPNERLLGFRLEAEHFDVKFYENWPGRPQEFLSKLNVLENGKVMATKQIVVNDPMTYKNFTFYQASYGRLNDFILRFRVVDKKNAKNKTFYVKSNLAEVQYIQQLDLTIVPIFAIANLQGLGPAARFQVLNKQQKPVGEPFWVLQNYKDFDFRRDTPYAVVLDEAEEQFYTGLQIGYDPGAPIYWFGCFWMLVGTFYALFVTHKKYQLRWRNGEWLLAGSIHRLPSGFERNVAAWAERLKKET